MEAAEKNRASVVIDGREYTIVGNESEEYMQSIARRVDEVITAYGSSTVNFSMKLVLAALNLADEAEKKKGRIVELEKLLSISEEKNEILQNNLNSMRSEKRAMNNIVKMHETETGDNNE